MPKIPGPAATTQVLFSYNSYSFRKEFGLCLAEDLKKFTKSV